MKHCHCRPCHCCHRCFCQRIPKGYPTYCPPPPPVETKEEKEARTRDVLFRLFNLSEKYKIKLIKNYTFNDDPDEIEKEYQMHKNKIHKDNQVKFYKQVLLNIVCGIEFLNEKYDPYQLKLRDWAKKFACDIDDYTPTLEELYEKYKEFESKPISPENKLILQTIMSAITYHLSQSLFGATPIPPPKFSLNEILSRYPDNKIPTPTTPITPATQNPDITRLLASLSKNNVNSNN